MGHLAQQARTMSWTWRAGLQIIWLKFGKFRFLKAQKIRTEQIQYRPVIILRLMPYELLFGHFQFMYAVDDPRKRTLEENFR